MIKKNKKNFKKDFSNKRNGKSYNQNAGITLVALVITIIVLLILSGISIAILSR